MALRARSLPSESAGTGPFFGERTLLADKWPAENMDLSLSRAARRVYKKIRQRLVDAVANEPPHAGRVIVLPLWIDREQHIGGPAGHGAGRQQDRVADGLIPPAPTIEHPGQHGHVQVGVVVHAHLALAVMQPVQPADVLGNRSAPRNGQRQEQGVEPGVVEPFADVSTGRQQRSALVLRDGRQASDDVLISFLSHAAAKHDQMRTLGDNRPARRSRCSLRSVSTKGDRPSRTACTTSSQMSRLRASSAINSS